MCKKRSSLLHRVPTPSALPGVRWNHDSQVAVARGSVPQTLARVAVEGGGIVGEEVPEGRCEEVFGGFVIVVVIFVGR